MSERIVSLDTLRGAALVGIVLGNVMWFSGYAVAPPELASTLDEAVAFGVHLFVDGKFYALFSLLFGAGFSLMVRRAEHQGLNLRSLVRARLLALGVMGLLHATLVWFGDIVSLYALAAIPLLWVHAWPRRRLVVLAGVCLSAPVVVSAVIWSVHVLVSESPAGLDPGHGPAALLPAFATGSYVELLTANAAFVTERWILALYSSRLLRLLGMFVIGVILARDYPRDWERPSTWLCLLALGSNLALAWLTGVPVRPPSSLGLLRDLVYALAIPSGCLVYAALLWRWAERRGPVARTFAAAGRLSFTHYVTQSLVMAALFYGCGLGLWGQLGAARAALVALVIVAAQVWVSPVIVRRFGHGPLERLLRVLARRYRSLDA